MPRPRIGKLRHRITIQSQGTNLDNEFGLAASSWTDERTVAAEVRTLAGRELEIARQRVAEASLIVTIRHVVGLTTQKRFKFKDRILHIGFVGDEEERGRFLKVLCTEEV